MPPFKKDARVKHPYFGRGTALADEDDGSLPVRFDRHGEKMLALEYARLEHLSPEEDTDWMQMEDQLGVLREPEEESLNKVRVANQYASAGVVIVAESINNGDCPECGAIQSLIIDIVQEDDLIYGSVNCVKCFVWFTDFMEEELVEKGILVIEH